MMNHHDSNTLPAICVWTRNVHLQCKPMWQQRRNKNVSGLAAWLPIPNRDANVQLNSNTLHIIAPICTKWCLQSVAAMAPPGFHTDMQNGIGSMQPGDGCVSWRQLRQFDIVLGIQLENSWNLKVWKDVKGIQHWNGHEFRTKFNLQRPHTN